MSAALQTALLAAPDDARVVQALRGHSGATVTLCDRAGKSFVRKTASGTAGNLRLRQQAIKQRLLAAQDFAFPAVRRIAQDEAGRAFFEMDYIPARTVGELVVGAVPFDRAGVRRAVGEMLHAFAATAQGVLSDRLFHGKIVDIVAQSRARALLAPYRDAIADLAEVFLARDWSGIPQSPDHGDLTLENILIGHNGQVVFIDCDAAWVSSFWLDMAKLFQDLEGRWFLRGDASPSVDALERLRLLGGEFYALAHKLDPDLPPRLGQLAALHLFRTLPYVQEELLAGFVCAAVPRLLEV